jgi:hypothetical protein
LLLKVAYLYWIYPQIYICEIYIIYFWWGIGLLIACFADWENSGTPDNYRIIMGYEYQEKKEGNLPV